MKRKPVTITVEEWLEELSRLGQLFDTDAEALTVKEIAEKLGRCREWVMKQLRTAAQKGRLVVVKKKIQAISGHVATVPAYKIK